MDTTTTAHVGDRVRATNRKTRATGVVVEIRDHIAWVTWTKPGRPDVTETYEVWDWRRNLTVLVAAPRPEPAPEPAPEVELPVVETIPDGVDALAWLLANVGN